MLSTEEIIERGLAASSLLENPTFKNVIASLMLECFATFTETKPSSKQDREDIYNLLQGLKAIEAELLARVQTKDRAVEQLDAENELVNQDDLDGPIYIQGNNNQ